MQRNALMHQEFTCYDRFPDPAVPLYNRRAIQGVPPLTGDGSQFDAPLDHTDPNPLLDDRHTPLSSGGRTFAVAFAVISALLVGLIAGFAGGYFVAQQTDPIPSPRSAAQAVVPVPTTAAQPQTYTDAPVNDQQVSNDQQLPVGRATAPHRAGAAGAPPEGSPGGPDTVRPTGAIEPQPRESTTVQAEPNTTRRDPNTMRRGP